jgi:signal transduction histidine kinase
MMRYRAHMNLLASLKSRILAIILLATLPLLFNAISDYRHERAAALDRLDADIHTMLRTTLLYESRVVDGVYQVLRIMGNANEMWKADPVECSALAGRIMETQPYLSNLVAATPDGNLFCSGRPNNQVVNIADRDYFKEVLATRQPVPGSYQIGRVSGQRSVAYAIPLLNDKNEVRAVLAAAIRLDWFDQMIKDAQLPTGWHALIITSDGFVAARYPRDLADEPLTDQDGFRLLDNARQGKSLHTIDVQGDEHLHGTVPLASTRGVLHLIIGTDTAQSIGPIEARFRKQIGITLLVALVSLVLAWFAIRGSVLDWVKHMNAVVFNFGSGNLDTRAGVISSVAELQLLTDNFDDMASRIETFNHELEARVAARTLALTRSNAELEAFAYSVSHDLRAPLRAVSGFSEILNESHGTQLDAEGRRYLDNVKRAADHMNHLIDDLLQFSRVGHSAVKIETVALAPMLHNLTMLFQSRLAPGGRIEIAAPLASPSGDPRLLKQILANLIDNAIKYQPAGQSPIIKISAVPTDDHVAIRVADNGIGIAPEYQEMIFKVFQRLHDEDAYPGTGIGLAIAQKAALLMNGSLTIESAPGQGSIFTLRLPAARQVSE